MNKLIDWSTVGMATACMTKANTDLYRHVLGHRDENTTLGSVHLFPQINRQERAKELVEPKIVLIVLIV